MKMLYIESVVEINPEDASKLGLSEGDELVVTAASFRKNMACAHSGRANTRNPPCYVAPVPSHSDQTRIQ